MIIVISDVTDARNKQNVNQIIQQVMGDDLNSRQTDLFVQYQNSLGYVTNKINHCTYKNTHSESGYYQTHCSSQTNVELKQAETTLKNCLTPFIIFLNFHTFTYFRNYVCNL